MCCGSGRAATETVSEMTNLHVPLLANQAAMAGCSFESAAYASALPPTHLLQREPSKGLRWTNLLDTWLVCRLAQATPLRLVWLGFLGCSDLDRWRVILRLDGVEVFDSRTGGTDLLCADAALALPSRKNRRHCFVLLPSAITADEVEITVFVNGTPRHYETGDALNYLDLGALVIAGDATSFFQSQRSMSYGLNPPSLTDPSRAAVAAPGQRAPLNRSPYDVATWELNYLTEAEAVGDLRDFMERVGTTKPVLALLKPLATQYSERWSILGLLERIEPLTLRQFNIFRNVFSIEGFVP